MKKRSFISLMLSFISFFSFLSPIYANNLAGQQHALIKVQATANIGIRTAGADLVVRSAPRLGNNVIGSIKQGNKVMVIEKDATGFWCRIDYKGNQQAWVICKYLMK